MSNIRRLTRKYCGDVRNTMKMNMANKRELSLKKDEYMRALQSFILPYFTYV